MNIQIISNDTQVIDSLIKGENKISFPIITYKGSANSLDIIDFIFSGNPLLLVLDDDFTKPNTVKILKSIRNIKDTLKVVFLTSDNSLTLGKEISGLAIQYYGIKPLAHDELFLTINALLKNRISNITN